MATAERYGGYGCIICFSHDKVVDVVQVPGSSTVLTARLDV